MTFSSRLAVGAGVLTAAMIGGSVPVSGLLVDYPLLSGQSLRYGLGAVLLAGWAWARRARIGLPRVADMPALLAIAAVGMLGFNAAMIAAQHHAEPGLVAAVLGGSPLVLAAVGPMLARKRPALRTLVGAVVVVAGVAVLSGGGTWSGPGLVLAVLTMLCEAAFTLLAVNVVRRRGALPVALWCHVIAAGAGIALATFVDGREAWRTPTGAEVSALLVVAVLTVVAFVLWYHAVNVLGPDRAGVLIGVMPVAGLVVSVAMGAQSLTWTAIAGVLVVGAGAALGLSSPPRQTRRSSPGPLTHNRPAPRTASR
ncbi:DMT family transporter [Actinokineospora iranica]|uniref:Permease of the drug/metabolite transporter (DMT) superfamily n=1 Tax=Actinokineospora iranica TaxID=1271860 RepID=A0A1G6RAQ0_9PSEU|nr:DMT family transporter [Actinokineospora iranica]SDD01689.1 Permease of the drug/metabolite transporter (DMT) superfamily [Actinokineospora iranica]